MSTATKKATKGKRYTPEEKAEILGFVEKHNAENGRGGQSAAAKKFGISQLSIASWLKSDGAPASRGRGKKAGVPIVSTKGGNYSAKLKTLTSLASQIDRAEGDLAKLKSKFQALKASL